MLRVASAAREPASESVGRKLLPWQRRSALSGIHGAHQYPPHVRESGDEVLEDSVRTRIRELVFALIGRGEEKP